jgi:hypothetical protein
MPMRLSVAISIRRSEGMMARLPMSSAEEMIFQLFPG